MKIIKLITICILVIFTYKINGGIKGKGKKKMDNGGGDEREME